MTRQEGTLAPKFAACQINVTADKEENHRTASSFVQRARTEYGANIVALPECWNCPYANSAFPDFAEDLSQGTGMRNQWFVEFCCRAHGNYQTESSPSAALLSRLAKENEIYLIGGSIPEREGEQLYNTSLTFGPQGQLLGKFRKIHLFDVDVPGKIKFIESDTLSPGKDAAIIETGGKQSGG